MSVPPSTLTRAKGTYTVVTERGATATPVRSGLSHAEAMTLAEKLRGEGQIVGVMHMSGDTSSEVDHYPAR